MALFEDLKRKWPHADHGPRKDCHLCKGKGEHNSAPCVCLFVDHDAAPLDAKEEARLIANIREHHGIGD